MAEMDNPHSSPTIEELRAKFLKNRPANPVVVRPAPTENQENEQTIKTRLKIEALIAKELPSYHLVKKPVKSLSEVELWIEEIKHLVERDMPGWTLAQSSVNSLLNNPSYKSVQSFHVQPKNGGPSKIAGVYNGRIATM